MHPEYIPNGPEAEAKTGSSEKADDGYGFPANRRQPNCFYRGIFAKSSVLRPHIWVARFFIGPQTGFPCGFPFKTHQQGVRKRYRYETVSAKHIYLEYRWPFQASLWGLRTPRTCLLASGFQGFWLILLFPWVGPGSSHVAERPF